MRERNRFWYITLQNAEKLSLMVLEYLVILQYFPVW